jgi:hypothetical protein
MEMLVRRIARKHAVVLLASLPIVATDFDFLPAGVLSPAPAQARVGHPLTPMSGAGVVRRTARRTTRRISTLPAGCVYGTYYGGKYYKCGGAYYAKDGATYVEVVF